MHDIDLSLLSDLYKDAHGVRPRGAQWEQYQRMSYSDFCKESEALSALIAEQADTDRRRQQDNLQDFWHEVSDMQLVHRISRARALQWVLDAHGLKDNAYDLEHLCYLRDLPYDAVTAIGSALREVRHVA